MRKLKTSKIFNVIVLAIGLMLSLWICQLIYEKQNHEALSELEHELIKFERKIDEELISSGEVLYSISNLYSAVDDLTPEIFNNFTKQLIRRKKSLLIVEWQPVVAGPKRASFINNAHKMGLKDFDFWEPDNNGNLIKARKRELHVPVLFAVSSFQTATTVGLDLAFSPERMNSKWESVETGKPRASETFPVIMSSTEKLQPTGFAITTPVFKKGSESGTLMERKKNIYSFVAAVFDVKQLLSHPIEVISKSNVKFKIVDLNNKSVVLENNFDKPSLISSSLNMDVYGRQWNLIVYAGEDFVSRFINLRAYILPLVFAVLFWVLYLFLEINRKKSLDLIETQDKLKVVANKAEAAAHSKAMFLANMSHELRTPLSSVLGYGELMKRESDPLKRERYLDVIIRSGKHLVEVINDILDISKLEGSKFQLNPRLFKLNDLINHLDELVAPKINNSKVEFIKTIDPDIDEAIFGDEFRIKQILINLLSNAFKFTDHGQVTLTVKKSVIDQQRFNLIFEISDTGKGISPEFQKNIFDPFTQEDISFSRGYGGTGLGLSIVFRLIKLMGGSITLNSELNKGSTFTITLPFDSSHS